MLESYVGLETAKMLKKLGFNIKTSACWDLSLDEPWLNYDAVYPREFMNDDDEIFYAPTLAVAQRWLREEKNIAVDIKSDKHGRYDFVVHRINMTDFTYPSVLCISACKFNTYEEALETGIQECLSLLLEENRRC